MAFHLQSDKLGQCEKTFIMNHARLRMKRKKKAKAR